MGVPPSPPRNGSAEPLWRAIAVFRFASLGYAALLTILNRADYARLGWAWAVIAVMAAWTIATTMAYSRPERRTRLLLSADLAVTAGLLLSTAALQYPSAMRHGVMPVTGIWVAGPVLAWAVRYGRRAGAITALIMSGCDFVLRHGDIAVVLNGVVLLLLAGVLIGHLARLAAEVEAERQHAAAVEAASRERERLARDIHDSVLQVLAMVQRRGAEAGGVAAEELASAVRAALDNVRRHCGEQARAWVLVEDEPGLVTVTIRDDGPGIPDGRLAEAAAAGRLGVSHSIRGRLRDLGGSASIRSAPGEGTEVELHLPRPAPVTAALGAG
jgi:signal transduction histidine kinase